MVQSIVCLKAQWDIKHSISHLAHFNIGYNFHSWNFYSLIWPFINSCPTLLNWTNHSHFSTQHSLLECAALRSKPICHKHMHGPNASREEPHRCTGWTLFLFSKATQSKTQGLGFTSVPFYVCGLQGENHLRPAAAKSSQQGPVFRLLHGAWPKTISAIHALCAKSTSLRHWDMVCEHQRPFLTKINRQGPLSRCCKGKRGSS